MKNTLKFLITISFGFSAPLMADEQSKSEPVAETESHSKATTETESGSEPTMTIVETAVANEDFSTLVAAIKAAGLVEALNGEGPLTVFAPTNEAFAKLPEGTVESLLKPENQGKLGDILKFHVSGGKLLSRDLSTTKVETLAGQPLTVVAEDGKTTIQGANVINADILTTNGVIHVIDTVLLPSDL